jgi:hypothetical protein
MAEEVDSIEEMFEHLTTEGGIGLIPTKDGLKVALAIDRKNPGKIFEDLNKFEAGLIEIVTKEFGIPDIEKIKSYSTLVDNIRKAAIAQCIEKDIDLSECESIPKGMKPNGY